MAKKKIRNASRRKASTPKPATSAPIESAQADVPPSRPQYRTQRWTQPYAPNPAMLRHILAQEGYTVFQWSDRPGTIYGMHKHESHQSHWIVSGTLEISVLGRGECILGPGDRDFMPAETYHSARVIGDEAVIYLIGEVEVSIRG